MSVLCPSCDAVYLPGPAVTFHDDDCPRLAALAAADEPCRAAATGFCDCPRHGGAS